jgi:flavin reductase (DIM6/NTAB) family NADH-FMN oxidoreductase RutF
MLDGAIAHLEGPLVSFTTQGDHDIVIVSVEYVASHPGAPLIYFRGGFGEFG